MANLSLPVLSTRVSSKGEFVTSSDSRDASFVRFADLPGKNLTSSEVSSLLEGSDSLDDSVRNFRFALREMFMRLNETTQKLEATQAELRQTKGDLKAIQSEKHQWRREMDELRFQMECLSLSTTDGHLLWKVSNVSERRQEAIDGKILFLYSPPFYTSPDGYKLSVQLYLDGNGEAKGSHISIFLIVMKSDHDAVLKWPMPPRGVRICILNQRCLESSDCVVQFKTNEALSFQRPRGDMSLGSGMNKFAVQSILEDSDYVKDDTLYVRVDVRDLHISGIDPKCYGQN